MHMPIKEKRSLCFSRNFIITTLSYSVVAVLTTL